MTWWTWRNSLRWKTTRCSYSIRQNIPLNIDGFVQERRNSSALAMELRLSCTNPSICTLVLLLYLCIYVFIDLFIYFILFIYLFIGGGGYKVIAVRFHIHVPLPFTVVWLAIVWLPQCQWSNPLRYGWNCLCDTTTKHNKAWTVCIYGYFPTEKDTNK